MTDIGMHYSAMYIMPLILLNLTLLLVLVYTILHGKYTMKMKCRLNVVDL